MPIKGFLERMKGSSEEKEDQGIDYIELESSDAQNDGKLQIRIESLSEFADTERIQSELRDGNIVWVKIKSLKEKDMAELKRSVDRLRKTCVAVNGDIAGIDEDFLILTPENVRIHRG
ncbi:MAG: cell division protein SepF [archaeon]